MFSSKISAIMKQMLSKKYSFLFMLLVLLPFITSAQKVPVSKKLKSETKYTINLYEAYKETKSYPLSMIAESVEYISLETTSECLLGEYLNNIFMDKNEIIVFDFEYAYRFSREGKFLNKIGKKGRGPGEYNRPMGIAIEPSTECIYFLDSNRLLQYTYSGEFIKEFDLDIKAMKILKYQKGIFLVDDMFYQYAKPEKRFSIRFFSEEDGKQIAKVECPKKDKIPFSIDMPVMYNFNGNTFVKDYWDNTVFEVSDPLHLTEYAFINTGKLKAREKDDKSVFTGKENQGEELVIAINNMAESERYIFMTSNKGLFFYDKSLSETYCCQYSQTGEKWSNFKDDIASGPDLISSFPKNNIKKNTYATFNNAYEFFEDGVDSSNPAIKKLKQNLQPDDNPVLVLVKLKE